MWSMTTTVVARLVAGALAALLAIGCGCDPVEPSWTPPPPPITFSISGVVAEAGTAIADAAVSVWVDTKTGGGWGGHGRTDAQGRYQFGRMPSDAHVRVTAYKEGYVQQCAAGPMVIHSDISVDLELISRTNITAASRPSAPGFRTVTGIVGEMTAVGLEPMAGISVASFIDPSGDAPAAATFTDLTGRFALCGLPGSEPVDIAAWVRGRFKWVTVPPGQESVEIVLP